jgi:hypothetical protein
MGGPVWPIRTYLLAMLALLAAAAVASPAPAAAPSARASRAASPARRAAPTAAVAHEPTMRLSAALTPERLGQGTTIHFGFTVTTPPRTVPSPVTGVELLYPENLGIATSGLGLETCTVGILEAHGPEGCPSQSQMGYGRALVVVPFGPEIIEEPAQTRVFMAHLTQGHLGLVFYAWGERPVDAWIVFGGLVLPTPPPYGGDLAATIPLVPTLPGAPYAAVVRFSTTIGPEHLTYYEHHRGRFLPYHPRGVILPRSCPAGGFHFGARLTFHNGTHASAATVVACPR